MNRFVIIGAAVAVALSTASAANANAIRLVGGTAYITFGDLDLNSHSGRSHLAGRIRTAARRICAEDSTDVLLTGASAECYRVAMSSGVEQMEAITAGKLKG